MRGGAHERLSPSLWVKVTGLGSSGSTASASGLASARASTQRAWRRCLAALHGGGLRGGLLQEAGLARGDGWAGRGPAAGAREQAVREDWMRSALASMAAGRGGRAWPRLGQPARVPCLVKARDGGQPAVTPMLVPTAHRISFSRRQRAAAAVRWGHGERWSRSHRRAPATAASPHLSDASAPSTSLAALTQAAQVPSATKRLAAQRRRSGHGRCARTHGGDAPALCRMLWLDSVPRAHLRLQCPRWCV